MSLKPKPILNREARTSLKWVLFGGIVATVGGASLSPLAAIPGGILLSISIIPLLIDWVVRKRTVGSSRVGTPEPGRPTNLR